MPAPAHAEKAFEVYSRLRQYYGEPERKPRRPPLDELILTILSQNTSDANSGRAWQRLKERFPSWEQVLEAEPEEIESAIHVGGLAQIKAARIQQILRHLAQRYGTPTLDFIQEMPPDEARRFLLDLPGVGPKTAACVLLFSLHMPALPVDTHVHRVSRRLGLIDSKVSPNKAHEILEALVPPDLYYSFHLLMIQHGREICKAQRPRCAACPLVEICPSAEAIPQAPNQAP